MLRWMVRDIRRPGGFGLTMTKGEVLGWVGNVGKVVRGRDDRGWELSRGWVSESCHDVIRILCLFLLDLCLLQLHLVELKFQTSEVLFNQSFGSGVGTGHAGRGSF